MTEKFVPFSLKANYLIVSNVSACKPCMFNVNVNLTIWQVLLESLVIDKAKQNKTGIFRAVRKTKIVLGLSIITILLSQVWYQTNCKIELLRLARTKRKKINLFLFCFLFYLSRQGPCKTTGSGLHRTWWGGVWRIKCLTAGVCLWLCVCVCVRWAKWENCTYENQDLW